jgi:osmotically-inducible protein OsmY
MSRSDKDIEVEISRTLKEIGMHGWQVEVVDAVVHINGTGSDRERGAVVSIAQSVKGVRHVAAQAPEA